MTEYYFDIETWDPNASGRPDPKKGQVIVVAYQPMSFGMPRGDLQIKSVWAGGGEKTVLQHVLDLGSSTAARDASTSCPSART